MASSPATLSPHSDVKPLLVRTFAAGDSVWEEIFEEVASGAELLLVFPGMEVDPLTHVTGEQPTQVPLLRLINQARLPLPLRAVDGFPADVVADVGAMVVNHQEKESCLLHGRTRVPPTLFAALNGPERDAEHLGELGLAQPDPLP